MAKSLSSKRRETSSDGSTACNRPDSSYRDDENFVRPSQGGKRSDAASSARDPRETSASGHDDQGGSRQSTRSDYQSAGARDQERYGEQNPQQRQDSDQRLREGNYGGQDSRDQSNNAHFSGHGMKSGEQPRVQDNTTESEESEGEELETYSSDTRDNFSRMYAEYKQRQEENAGAAQSGKSER